MREFLQKITNSQINLSMRAFLQKLRHHHAQKDISEALEQFHSSKVLSES